MNLNLISRKKNDISIIIIHFFWHILRKIISKFNILAVVVHRVLLSNTHLIEIPILNKISLVVAVQNMRIMTTIKDQIQTEDNKNNFKRILASYFVCSTILQSNFLKKNKTNITDIVYIIINN